MSNEKYYPFKGVDFTAEEINALLKSIQNKIDRNLVRDGKSAYEVAVQNGYTGTVEEWLESLRGKSGNFQSLSEEEVEELQRPSVELAQQAVENSKEIWFPHVDSSGVISWTRSKIEVPPQGVSIKGDKGDKGDSGVSGTTDDIIVVNSLDGGGGNPDKIYVLDAEQGRQLKNLINGVQGSVDEVKGSVDVIKDLADVTASNCGFVVAVDYHGGTLYDKIPKELRKPGLIVEYKSASIGDKINFKARRFIGKDVSDKFWLNGSYWEEVFKEPTPYVLTSGKIYDVLPKGSILQSAYGNIFGDKWTPMENVVAWDVSSMTEASVTAIKGWMNVIYAKGCYYCYGIGMGILYSSDLNTWNIADLRGDGQKYELFSLTYSKSNDTLFATAIVDENNTVKSYYSKDGITWNEYTVGDAVIVGFVVSGNNTMLATVVSNGTTEKMKYYIADGTDIESASWSLLSDKEYTPTLYSVGYMYFDDTRSKYITVTGDGIYEKGDDTTSLLELKSSLPGNIAMPELSSNDKDNTYILRSKWDIHRFTYIAKNKDTSTWEEFKVQVSTDGEMLSSFVFSIKDIYYVLQPATFVGGALESITLMGNPSFEYAVTDGEYFIGFNFTEGKIYRTKLAQALDPVQYGYIKLQ